MIKRTNCMYSLIDTEGISYTTGSSLTTVEKKRIISLELVHLNLRILGSRLP